MQKCIIGTSITWLLSPKRHFTYILALNCGRQVYLSTNPFDEAAYHCGDGWGLKSGNRTSIGIEICGNPEINKHNSEENAIALGRIARFL